VIRDAVLAVVIALILFDGWKLIPLLARIVADSVRLQRLLPVRPGEQCSVTDGSQAINEAQ
jgi:hypothetical protein